MILYIVHNLHVFSGTLRTDLLFLIFFFNVGLATSGKVMIVLNEEEITLIHARGQVHAIQEKCPHQGIYSFSISIKLFIPLNIRVAKLGSMHGLKAQHQNHWIFQNPDFWHRKDLIFLSFNFKNLK